MSLQGLRISSRNGASKVFILLLLSLYLVGSLEVGALHSLLHSAPNEVELHSEANETNACHQSVYHNKKEKECEHKSHVVSHKKCSLCQFSMQSFQLFVNREVCQFEIPSELLTGITDALHTISVRVYVPSRAPPLG